MTDKEKYFNRILEKASKHGWIVLSTQYINRITKYKFLCPQYHENLISGANFSANNPVCKTCKHLKYSNDFKNQIENLGGKVIGTYINNSTKVECMCINDHTCFVKPASVQQGQGMCNKCANRSKDEAEKIFINQIEILGGKVIGNYNGAHKPVNCICKNGHECTPRPSSIRLGRGMCKICAGKCKTKAEKKFVYTIENLGGKVIGKYINRNTGVDCVCKNGHECKPHPAGIRQGQGMCKICVKSCPIEAKKIFFQIIENKNIKIVSDYVNGGVKVNCLCPNNHRLCVYPRNVNAKGISCKICNNHLSYGERLVVDALNILNIIYDMQVCHESIMALRFDFNFCYNNLCYYIEYDGEQHFIENKLFHKSENSFKESRQRDLLKNHIISKDQKSILIRLDYRWGIDRKPENRFNIVNQLAMYIKECTKSHNKIICDPIMYDWIYETPSQETFNKYYADSDLDEDYSNESDLDEGNSDESDSDESDSDKSDSDENDFDENNFDKNVFDYGYSHNRCIVPISNDNTKILKLKIINNK